MMNEPYINLPDQYGIRSLVLFRPETGKHLYELVQVLLREPSPLSQAEREMIAAYVSHLNECAFCSLSHAAAAKCLLGDQSNIVDELLKDEHEGVAGKKMKVLLRIAAKVQRSGREVTQEDIEAARKDGANDMDIHDTVLIAAVFSMFNRYVDGLNTTAPDDPSEYVEMGRRMAGDGYQFKV